MKKGEEIGKERGKEERKTEAQQEEWLCFIEKKKQLSQSYHLVGYNKTKALSINETKIS